MNRGVYKGSLMFRNVLLFVCLLVPQVLFAGELEVIIENPRVAEGQIMLRLLQGEAEFKGEKPPYAALQRRAQAKAVGFVFKHLPPGEYAVQVMHDVNDNGELDTNFIGMPREPWAFSNNAAGNMGPPTWEDVRFNMAADESLVQSIRLNH